MAATTTSHSFTATGAGAEVVAPAGTRLVYRVSGTFDATVVLEEFVKGGWRTLLSFAGAGVGSLVVEPTNESHGRYRFRCTVFASGTVVTDLIRVSSINDYNVVPYNASDYTAQAGTWTVDAADKVTLIWQVTGKRMHVIGVFTASALSATPTSIEFPIPGGYKAAVLTRAPFNHINAAAGSQVGTCGVPAGGSAIQFFKDYAAGAWAAGALDFGFDIEFEVQ